MDKICDVAMWCLAKVPIPLVNSLCTDECENACNLLSHHGVYLSIKHDKLSFVGKMIGKRRCRAAFSLDRCQLAVCSSPAASKTLARKSSLLNSIKVSRRRPNRPHRPCPVQCRILRLFRHLRNHTRCGSCWPKDDSWCIQVPLRWQSRWPHA